MGNSRNGGCPFSLGVMTKKRLINLLFKATVILLPAFVLYREIGSRDDLPEIVSVFWHQLHHANPWYLWAAFILVPLNWLAEVQKWRPFVQRHEALSMGKALGAVLAGYSFALFTPNRIGEYGGRILFVSPRHQWKAFAANVVGSIGQYLVLLTGGITGGIWFAGQKMGWSGAQQTKVLCASLPALLAACFCYFNIGLIIPVIARLPVLKKADGLISKLRLLQDFTRRDLAYVWYWSVLRYAIYSSQYFLLLQFFDIKTGVLMGFSGIATIFLLQTVVPLPAIAGLLVRGSLAIFIWTYFSANEVGILAATFVLWIINLILPALIGTFSLSHVNITTTLGYEDE